MTPSDFDRMGARAMEMIDALTRHTSDSGRLTRLYLSPAHRQAAAEVAAFMSSAGMSVTMDAVGSVTGRYEGATPGARALLIGSHIDSVLDAGKFDGPLGVTCGIALVEALQRQNLRLPFALEIIAFGDEECIRFPTSLSTSRALAGRYDREWLDCQDEDGIVLRDALTAFGGDPAGVDKLARDPARLLGYIEVHIEQGPVLETADVPVGVVSAINGISRVNCVVGGEAGHGGTVPMAARRDALMAFAEMAGAVRAVATALPDAVATIGKVTVSPGAVNVIPNRVEFIVEARSPDDDARYAMVDEMEARLNAIARQHGVTLEFDRYTDVRATAMSPDISAALAASVTLEQIPLRKLPSGAGHDAMIMAEITQAAMLFVRCKGGISHSPQEWVDPLDVTVALRVLYRTVLALGAEGSSHG